MDGEGQPDTVQVHHPLAEAIRGDEPHALFTLGSPAASYLNFPFEQSNLRKGSARDLDLARAENHPSQFSLGFGQGKEPVLLSARLKDAAAGLSGPLGGQGVPGIQGISSLNMGTPPRTGAPDL